MDGKSKGIPVSPFLDIPSLVMKDKVRWPIPFYVLFFRSIIKLPCISITQEASNVCCSALRMRKGAWVSTFMTMQQMVETGSVIECSSSIFVFLHGLGLDMVLLILMAIFKSKQIHRLVFFFSGHSRTAAQ